MKPRLDALMRNRSFLRYWAATAISLFGSQLSLIAFPLLTLGLTGSLTKAGLLGSCSLIARLACRIPAGQLADRYDRRWLMLGADLIRLVAVGSIPLTAAAGSLGYPQLLVVAVVEGVATAVFSPAADVALRDVVDKPDIRAALSRAQASYSSAMLVGPALGGVLYSVDRILPFTVDAVSYLISAVLLVGMAVKPPERAAEEDRDNRFSAGLRWLGGQPKLLWVLLFLGTLNVAGTAAEIGVVLSLRERGAPGSSIGVVMAGAGVGAVIGSLLAPRLIKLFRPGLLFLLTGLIWAAGFLALATRPPLPVVAAVLVLLLLVVPSAGVVLGEAILSNTPRDLLGRVGTAVDTSTAGLASLGPFMVGAAIQGLGVSSTWVVLAAIAAGVSLLAARPLWQVSTLLEEDEDAAEAEVTPPDFEDGVGLRVRPGALVAES